MTITAEPEMLRASKVASDKSVGVSVSERLIRGYVVAELGDFKDKRGSFDSQALDKIVELGNAAGSQGMRSRLGHPNESDDGLTKHLGRSSNFRRDGNKVRADLKIASVAMDEPVGGGKPIGQYVMDLATEDPGAIGSSLVLKTEKLERKGPDGERLPPLWTPTQLFASDIVADGDAVHGDLLSVDALDEFMEGSQRRIPTKLAVAGAQYLDQMFPDSDRDVIAARMDAFKERYLARRFGADAISLTTSLTSGDGINPKESDVDQETSKAIEDLNGRIDALSKTNSELLASQTAQAGVIESLHQMMKEDVDSRKAAQSQTNRAAEIAALCKQAGNKNAEQFIADESLSVQDVMRKLIAEKPKADEGLSSGGNESEHVADPLAKLRAEYAANIKHLHVIGYRDRETWVRHQCRDKGIDYKAA